MSEISPGSYEGYMAAGLTPLDEGQYTAFHRLAMFLVKQLGGTPEDAEDSALVSAVYLQIDFFAREGAEPDRVKRRSFGGLDIAYRDDCGGRLTVAGLPVCSALRSVMERRRFRTSWV